jgi:hypothetical protein
MDRFLKLSPDDRATAFINTGYDKGLSPAIVEKDFWVCLILDCLFSESESRYDLAKPGSLRLLPPKESLLAIEQDYARMQNMLYGVAPSFDEIISSSKPKARVRKVNRKCEN